MSIPHPLLIEPFLREALREDMGRAGDITTDAIAPADMVTCGSFSFRQAGRVCGIGLVQQIFSLLDPTVTVTLHAPDGTDVEAGTSVAMVRGPARALLSGERVALNLLGRLSAIATITHHCAERARPYGARIACTRKTTPGLRLLEKWAVRTGDGFNHRFGLDDGILIKDNHIAVAGSVTEAVRRARAGLGHMVKIEVEVDTLEQLAELLALGTGPQGGADAVLLDNMGPDQLRKAVTMVDGRLITEASGGITPETIADIAATGVNVLSLGFLTHGVRSLDVGLDF